MTIQQLFDEYTFQRKNKVSADNALQLLVKLSPTLPERDRQQLSKLIRQWEIQQQSLEKPAADDMMETTQVIIPPHLAQGDAAPVHNINCSTCGTTNPPESKYCYACGSLLANAPHSSVTGALPDEEEDPATFGSFSMLVVTVQGHADHPLRINMENRPLIVGRSDENSSSQPDVDLAIFNAQDFGVSRQHAILKRENQTITLIDQGSVNHTYINGEKLHHHEVRVIRDGDEVRFGRLNTRFTFHRQLRRLGN